MATDSRQRQSGSWHRRAQTGLLIPIGVVLGLLAFTSVASSAASVTARTPSAASGVNSSGGPASAPRSDGSRMPASDPRFDVAANPASSQYCPHTNQPPPCGGGGGGGGGKGAGTGSFGGGAGGNSGAGTATATPATHLTSSSANQLPFTGENVLLVILAGLLLTELGLTLNARSRTKLRTS